jgi:chromosome segregation ATPase
MSTELVRKEQRLLSVEELKAREREIAEQVKGLPDRYAEARKDDLREYGRRKSAGSSTSVGDKHRRRVVSEEDRLRVEARRARLARLEAEYGIAEADLESVREEQREARAAIAPVREKVEAARAELDEVEKPLRFIESRRSKAARRAATLRGEINELRGSL